MATPPERRLSFAARFSTALFFLGGQHRIAAFAALTVAVAAPPLAAFAQSQSSAVAGSVVTADGVPVAGATVVLTGNGPDQTARSGRDGTFTFSDIRDGTYGVRASAPGFDVLTGRTIRAGGEATSSLRLTMSRSASSLTVIGSVQTNGTQALSDSASPTTTINAQAYAGLGYTNMAEVLQNDIATTLVHPLGGSPALPTSVALRGPDPTETLVDIDGHQVNNGNTGDFDLSLVDPADYSVAELVEGISPSSLVGPTTIDGAINIRTLEPTADPHATLRFSAGSFDSFAETVESTGTSGRLGYAFSLHRTTTAGEVNQSILDVSASPGTIASVGSSVDSSTALGKLRYSFGRGDSYVDFTFHDQSTNRDLSAALSSFAGPGSGFAPYDAAGLPELVGFEGTSAQSHNASYGFDVATALGPTDGNGQAKTTFVVRHLTSLVSQSVFGPGTDSSPYLDNYQDPIDDEIVELDHQLPHGTLSLQYEVRNEQLLTDYVPGGENVESIGRSAFAAPLGQARLADDDSGSTSGSESIGIGQTQRSAVLRYTLEPTAKLHYNFATYYSRFSAFGSSIDPRFGFVWTPTAQSLVRFSLGTTYQTPQLPELLVLPNTPAVGGIVSNGNPNLQPDRATEYGLGFEHLFGGNLGAQTKAELELYRVNLRTPASTLVVAPSTNPACNPGSGDGSSAVYTEAAAACPVSFPVNAGDGVYQGIELRVERPVARWTTVNAGYALRSAYLSAVPSNIQDGTLVLGEQDLGLPLHKATISLQRSPPVGFEFGATAVYEGLYNELDQGQYMTLDANLGYRLKEWELNLSATNLTNVYDQRFTTTNGGLSYGAVGAALPTDAYALQGTKLTATLTRRI